MERNPEWADLEETIIKLIKEHYRLLGMVVLEYESLDPEIDELIIGTDDPRLSS